MVHVGNETRKSLEMIHNHTPRFGENKQANFAEAGPVVKHERNMADRKAGKSQKGRQGGTEIAPQQPQAKSEVIVGQLQFSFPGTSMMASTLMAEQKRNLASFQMSLADRDEKIDNLQQKVKELERDKSNLQDELKSKNQEIAFLKPKKVSGLESDKKKLQEEVEELKTKIKEHESEINDLTATVKTLQQENDEGKSQMDKLTADVSNLKKDLAETNRDKSNLTARLKKMELQQGMYTPEQERTLKSTAFLAFGEMCRQLQNKMYQEVIPDEFAENYDYSVKYLKKDIGEIQDTEPQRAAEIRNRWDEMKRRLGWQDKLIKTIASLKQDRNALAHPPVTEADVRWFLEEMKKNKMLPARGFASAGNVKMLVDMWASFNAQ